MASNYSADARMQWLAARAGSKFFAAGEHKPDCISLTLHAL